MAWRNRPEDNASSAVLLAFAVQDGAPVQSDFAGNRPSATGTSLWMSQKFEYSTVAACAPEHIWRVFEEIERWPRWDPDAIQSARWISGAAWQKGSRFEIRIAKPVSYTISPEVLDVQHPIYIHWRGKGSGITGEQYFIFKPLPDGSTEMHTLQEFSGAPVALFGGKLRSAIQAGIEHMFSRIKSEAEALAASPMETPTSTSTETVAEILATSLAESLATIPVDGFASNAAELEEPELEDNQSPQAQPELNTAPQVGSAARPESGSPSKTPEN